MKIRPITYVAAVAATAVALAAAPAAAATPGSGNTAPGTVAVSETSTHEKAHASTPVPGALSTVPADVEEALWTLSLTQPDPDVWFAWDSERQILQAHHSGPARSRIAGALRGLDVRTEIVRDAVPRSLLLAEAERVAQLRTTPDGTPIAFAAPNSTGDGLTVGLVTDESTVSLRSGRATAVPDLSTYPVDLERSPGFEAASRLSYSTPFIAGARISRPVGDGKYTSCTTSFPIGVPLASGWRSMILTAQHCGGPETTWMRGLAGSSTLFGVVPTGEAAVSDAIAVRGPDANVAIQHAPYVFWGSYDTNSAAPVRGAVVPVVGNQWCHSGSYSGTVCGNQVVATGVATCYGLLGPCYTGLVRTLQGDGISSVGNGDSGGASIAAYLDEDGYVQALAAGTISGMSNSDPDSCRGLPGQPDGRECSAQALIAPISLYLQQTGRSIFVTTQ